MDILLAVESEDLRQKMHELDVLDKKIEEDFNSARMNDEILEKSIQDLKNSIRNQERAADLNQERAEALSRIDLEEIRNLAFSSLTHIQQIEDQNIMTQRCKEETLLWFCWRSSVTVLTADLGTLPHPLLQWQQEGLGGTGDSIKTCDHQN